ncbi:magnesium chelatase ATPase subunit D [Methylobacterium sp. Leaf456]|uniref:magnesium chelatase subunit D n=1 Tax=Methylobacterium sp. Leaf456 TaxID=1736382 RepID=UPI0006F2325D|nr:magnesium chelatase subunit D [Methylobacterium sp. Leaf456]KQT50471.1 magnesium chelatase ATPase subunit D [Methylobacterium sp. Leaf456]
MGEPAPNPAWDDSLRALALFAADPHGLGGLVLRAGAGPVRDRWLDLLRTHIAGPLRRLPPGIGDDRLIGGLDLPATLRAGRPVAQSGLLAEADGGVVIVPMAERLEPGTVARLCAALDTGVIALERDGLAARLPARIGLVLLDEGIEDEAVAEALADRLAFRIDLTGVSLREAETTPSYTPPHPEVPAQRASKEGSSQPRAPLEPSFEAALRFAPQDEGEGWEERGGVSVELADDPVTILCNTAAALGIASLRAPLLALRAARIAAGGPPDDAALMEAARLVLAPRATRLPAPQPQDGEASAPEEQAEPPPETQSQPDDSPPPESEADESAQPQKNLDEVVIEAAQAAIPKDLLARLLAGGPSLRKAEAGRKGAAAASQHKGRPVGSRPGDPRRGRLDLIATLRTAAPWQRLRRGEGETRRVIVAPEDFRIRRFRQRSETTAIFCVDASGSAALERLAEAKGAVELLLAEAYVRRDRVALVAFRGAGAEVLLPPTRSLVRAKRALAGLPGGGGTPLAAGLDAATALGLAVRRAGGTPVVVLLTDGRANVARSGLGGRALAGEEALAAGRAIRHHGLRILVIDTGARPDGARALADAAQARYCPLPMADAGSVRAAVRAATA